MEDAKPVIGVLIAGAFFGSMISAVWMPQVIDNRWEKRLIEAGLAHYDPLTAEWILDAEQE